MTEKKAKGSGFRSRKVMGALVALGLLLLFNLFFTPNFFRITIMDGHLFGTVIDILNRGSIIMLIAVGITFVIATGGTDLSIGAVIAISGAVAAKLVGGQLEMVDGEMISHADNPMWLAIVVALLVATLCGMWNGFLVSYLNIQPIVATLVLMVAGRGIAQLITDGQIITIYYKPFLYIGNGFLAGLPFPIFLVIAVFAFAMLITRRTSAGMFIEAVGINANASRYAGIDARAVKTFCYAFSGFCAGMAGLIVCANVKGADANNAGLNSELDAILSCVIGGTAMTGGRFSLAGSLVGALLIQTLTSTIYAFGVPPEVILVVKALVVVLVCFLQSDWAMGLFSRSRKKDRKASKEVAA